MSQHLLYQRLWNWFVSRSWKMFLVALALALLLIGGIGQGHVQAASHQPSSLHCDVRTFALNWHSTLTLQRSSGEVYKFEADNLNHRPAVDIWHDDDFQGVYGLTAYDGDFGDGYEIQIYSSNGRDLVDTCLNWSTLGND